MWEWIKSKFRKEPELPEENVELAQLDTWLNEKTNPVFIELNNKLSAAKTAVAQEIELAKQNIDNLVQAQLHNPDIPERAKHFMQGNREAYIKKIIFFLNSIHFPSDVRDYDEFHAAIQQELKELAQGTARPYQILQEFLADETRKISSNIAVIEKEINQLKNATDTGAISSIDSAKAMIKDLELKLELKNRLSQEKDSLQKQHDELKTEISKLNNEIQLLKKDKELNELKKQHQELKTKIEEVRERITGPFSTIDAAMRKFERITYRHREIMLKYIESPLDALMQDLHLGILKAFADMQMAILNNRIDLKDRKKEKALEILKLLNKDYLGSFLTEYGQLKKDEIKIRRLIDSSDVIILINEKNEAIEKAESEKNDIERKIAECKKELDKLNPEEIHALLLESLKKITKTKVSIKL